jgi:Pyridine nucleotide-disulphide oxidoreductase
MSYSIAIIGAGWYGCHLASSLDAIGMSVKVFERNARPLHEASGNNQFRLHMGFHYARHYNTRMQSRDGYMRFIERYPSLSGKIENNIYAVPSKDSLIDFLTYRLIMTSSGIDFSETCNINCELKNIDGLLVTEERVLHTETARSYFIKRLGKNLNFDTPVEFIEEKTDCVIVNGERFDYVIDATWGHFKKPPMQVFYEPTILLYYQQKDSRTAFPAVTLVDGPLSSIYPTEDPSLYTLSSVPHTPVGQFSTSEEARAVKNSINTQQVHAKVARMEAQISHYIPDFKDHFEFVAPQLSIKTKPVGSYDDRSCHVFKQDRVFSVMSGKIDTVFFATERILSMLDSLETTQFAKIPSVLKQELELNQFSVRKQ